MAKCIAGQIQGGGVRQIAALLRLKEPQVDLSSYGSIITHMNTWYKSMYFADFVAIHATQEA